MFQEQQQYQSEQQARETMAEIAVSLAATPRELVEETSAALVNIAGGLPVDETTPRMVEGALILSIIREISGTLDEKGCVRSSRHTEQSRRQQEKLRRRRRHSTVIEGALLGG